VRESDSAESVTTRPIQPPLAIKVPLTPGRWRHPRPGIPRPKPPRSPASPTCRSRQIHIPAAESQASLLTPWNPPIHASIRNCIHGRPELGRSTRRNRGVHPWRIAGRHGPPAPGCADRRLLRCAAMTWLRIVTERARKEHSLETNRESCRLPDTLVQRPPRSGRGNGDTLVLHNRRDSTKADVPSFSEREQDQQADRGRRPPEPRNRRDTQW
jgi:hypothetical protein